MSFIYPADSRILSVPIIECDEPLVDVTDFDILLYGPPPETPLTKNFYTKIRKTVFDKLCQAQEDLPEGWRFRLYEGFRSLEVQAQLFEEEYQRVTESMPDAPHQERFNAATRLISPVINLDGSKNIPPHNTGAAVDVEIITADGNLVDMGMAIKDWASVNPDLCLSNYKELNSIITANRQILLNVMHAHGFINYPGEWWHFSYGDRYWAYHRNEPHAIYGLIAES